MLRHKAVDDRTIAKYEHHNLFANGEPNRPSQHEMEPRTCDSFQTHGRVILFRSK